MILQNTQLPNNNSPFCLGNDCAYATWRRARLSHLASKTDLLSSSTDIANALQHGNAALFQLPVDSTTPASLTNFGHIFGLYHADNNIRAGAQSVSALKVTEQNDTQYIPYTNRQLSWHTDGYYNPKDKQVNAWLLYCVRAAEQGGISEYIDHNIIYIMLRDLNPDFIQALMQPDAMTIPENRENGKLLRPATSGPVFSINPANGQLHMRYSARKRNIAWSNKGLVKQAAKHIHDILMDDETPIIRYKLASGEGIISGNVLHRRTSFADSEQPAQHRLLYRIRYFDSINLGANTL